LLRRRWIRTVGKWRSARAPSAVTRQSFLLAALSQPRAAPSTAGALVAPRGL
jgi:hypothetical protein